MVLEDDERELVWVLSMDEEIEENVSVSVVRYSQIKSALVESQSESTHSD